MPDQFGNLNKYEEHTFVLKERDRKETQKP